MINTKKIILISVVILVIVSSLIFLLSLKTKSTIQEETISNKEAVTNNIDSNENLISNSNEKNSEQIDGVSEKNITWINQTVTEKFPEISLADLNTFSEITLKSDNIHDCHDTDKTAECEYYFAVYNKRSDVCGHMHTKDLELACYRELALFDIEEKLDKCKKISGDNSDCLNSLFFLVEEEALCSIFSNQEINQLCLDVVNSKKSVFEGVQKCALIKNEILKNKCELFFVAGDFDDDGLLDKEEATIGTNPYLSDTDSDGFSDKEEFSGGYNPCGEGRVPSAVELLKACTKYTN